MSELVEADDETAAYVADLEQRTDDDPATELADGSALIEEVERFLRRQSPGD